MAAGRNGFNFFLTGDVIRYLQKSGACKMEFFYIEMADYSGTDGLFWYFKFNGKSASWIFIFIYDDIIPSHRYRRAASHLLLLQLVAGHLLSRLASRGLSERDALHWRGPFDHAKKRFV
jgi:hypothetical protein